MEGSLGSLDSPCEVVADITRGCSRHYEPDTSLRRGAREYLSEVARRLPPDRAAYSQMDFRARGNASQRCPRAACVPAGPRLDQGAVTRAGRSTTAPWRGGEPRAVVANRSTRPHASRPRSANGTPILEPRRRGSQGTGSAYRSFELQYTLAAVASSQIHTSLHSRTNSQAERLSKPACLGAPTPGLTLPCESRAPLWRQYRAVTRHCDHSWSSRDPCLTD
jgi:hypothetical protein